MSELTEIREARGSTEASTWKNRKRGRTNAERCKEYRKKKKILFANVPNNLSEKKTRRKIKTNAEICKAYRERQKKIKDESRITWTHEEILLMLKCYERYNKGLKIVKMEYCLQVWKDMLNEGFESNNRYIEHLHYRLVVMQRNYKKELVKYKCHGPQSVTLPYFEELRDIFGDYPLPRKGVDGAEKSLEYEKLNNRPNKTELDPLNTSHIKKEINMPDLPRETVEVLAQPALKAELHSLSEDTPTKIACENIDILHLKKEPSCPDLQEEVSASSSFSIIANDTSHIKTETVLSDMLLKTVEVSALTTVPTLAATSSTIERRYLTNTPEIGRYTAMECAVQWIKQEPECIIED